MAKKLTIQPGDTLSDIAQREGATVEGIQQANPDTINDPDRIFAGDEITIPEAEGGQGGGQNQTVTDDEGNTVTQTAGSGTPPGVGAVEETTGDQGPMNVEDMERGANAPEPESVIDTTGAENFDQLNREITNAADQYLNKNEKKLDKLRQRKMELVGEQRQEAEEGMEEAAEGLSEIAEGTPAEDATKKSRELFEVEETIRQVNKVNTKLVDAIEGLNMGLAFEESRPDTTRQQILLGRQKELKEQGMAQISALQAVSSRLQGHIELAKGYANQSINAINSDRTAQRNALTTLKSLHQQNFLTLTTEENETIDNRISSIESAQKRTRENSKRTRDLIVQYPEAALDGGVAVTDDPDTVIEKMLPKLSEKEKERFNAKIGQITGTGTGTGTTQDDQQPTQTSDAAINNVNDAIKQAAKELHQVKQEGRLNDTVFSEYIRGIMKTFPNAKAPGQSDQEYFQTLDSLISQEMERIASVEQGGDVAGEEDITSDFETGPAQAGAKVAKTPGLVEQAAAGVAVDVTNFWNGLTGQDEISESKKRDLIDQLTGEKEPGISSQESITDNLDVVANSIDGFDTMERSKQKDALERRVGRPLSSKAVNDFLDVYNTNRLPQRTF